MSVEKNNINNLDKMDKTHYEVAINYSHNTDKMNTVDNMNKLSTIDTANNVFPTDSTNKMSTTNSANKISTIDSTDKITTADNANKRNTTYNPDEIFETFMSLKPSQIKYLKDTIFSEGRVIPAESQHSLEGTCPDCGSSLIIKFGRNRLGKQRYRCKHCRRIFVIPTKSPLSYSKKTARHWLLYMECMVKGMSIRKTASVVGIQINTSFYWRHKILNALKSELTDSLSGIVEIDEVIIPESYKGNHSKNEDFYMGRAPRKRGIKLSEALSVRRVRVLCCLDRTEDIFSQVIGRQRPGVKDLISILEYRIKEGSTICTNNNAAYKFISKKLNLKLYKLVSSNQVIEGIYHNQKAKSFGWQLKRFLVGFNGVATKYLNHYITWLKWICRGKGNNSDFEDIDMFMMVAFSSARLRVCDLRLVNSIPESVCS